MSRWIVLSVTFLLWPVCICAAFAQPLTREQAVDREPSETWAAVRSWLGTQAAVVNVIDPDSHLVTVIRALSPAEVRAYALDGAEISKHVPVLAHMTIWVRPLGAGASRLFVRVALANGWRVFHSKGALEAETLHAIRTAPPAAAPAETGVTERMGAALAAVRAARWSVNAQSAMWSLLTITGRIEPDKIASYTGDRPARYQPGFVHATVLFDDPTGPIVKVLITQPGADPLRILASNGRVEAAVRDALAGNSAAFPLSASYEINNGFWSGLFSDQAVPVPIARCSSPYLLPAPMDRVWAALLILTTQAHVIAAADGRATSLRYVTLHPTSGKNRVSAHSVAVTLKETSLGVQVDVCTDRDQEPLVEFTIEHRMFIRQVSTELFLNDLISATLQDNK